MIGKVVIRNFQSHRKTVIRFAPGVNAIVGSTDCGKSGIVRALRWAFFGKPGGDSIQSYWGGDTSVSVTLVGVPGVSKIVRHLPVKGSPYYRIFRTNPKNDQVRVETLRGTSAEKRIRVVSDGMVRLKEGVNFQCQHDAPFMLDDTGASVTKAINEVVDLSKMDVALTHAKRQEDAAKVSKRMLAAECEKLHALAKAARRRVTVLESLYASIEERYAVIAPLMREAEELSQLLAWIDDAETRLHAAKMRLRFADQMDALIKKAEDLDALHRQASALYKLLRRTRNATKAIRSYKDVLPDENVVRNLDAKAQELSALDESAALLMRDLDAVERAQRKQAKVRKELKAVEATIKDELGETCPLCEQAVPHAH